RLSSHFRIGEVHTRTATAHKKKFYQLAGQSPGAAKNLPAPENYDQPDSPNPKRGVTDMGSKNNSLSHKQPGKAIAGNLIEVTHSAPLAPMAFSNRIRRARAALAPGEHCPTLNQ